MHPSVKKYILYFLLAPLSFSCFAQQKEIDSLKAIYNSNAHDSIRLNALNALIWPLYSNSRPDSGIKYGHIAVKIAEKNNYLTKLTVTYRRLAICYTNITDYKQGLFYHEKSLELARKLNNPKDIGIALGNIGVVYQDIGDKTKALDYNLQSIKLKEKLNDHSSIFNNYYNIGLIYKEMGELDKAQEAMKNCIKYSKLSGNDNSLGVGYNGLGIVYKTKKQFDSAAYYYRLGIQTNTISNNFYNVSESYVNYGSYFIELKQFDSATFYLNKSLEIAKQINLKGGISNALANIAFCHVKTGQYKKGIDYALESIRTTPEDLGNKSYCYEILTEAYQKTGDYKKALEATLAKKATDDTLQKLNVSRDLIKLNLQFDFDKKLVADSIKFAEHEKISSAKVETANTKLKLEKAVRYALLIGLFLLLIFSYFIFTRFKLIKKQNKIIDQQQKETEQQRALLEEKQKEIIDSIKYANRIQRALLATDTLLAHNLNVNDRVNYFLFFKPKAIVSGDFYWASKLSNGKFAFVTADCTGHGVPGAFMSLLNISFLNEAINERLLTDTGEILDHVRKRVIEALAEDGSSEGGKDGMDCNIVVYDFNTSTIEYSAAYNPIWICRNSEIIELNCDKMPVGKHDKDHVSFSKHVFQLKKDDIVYTFTDGYPDQFGGPKGKKFKYKQLHNLLLANSKQTLIQQREALHKTFYDWKGNLEQIDDVCVIGVRI